MIKLKASHSTEQEKDKLLLLIKSAFRFEKEPKIYKKEGPYKYI
ncbi:hypothetical protein ACJDU8_18930 [Clostridium sp. WILCCON 0269]|uniref:Uncharacterized protein n=1 Tax=Candidatus Clostridium eludens TaxID=3381663 RepID=A0ABW8SPE9_9CLOT